MRKLESASGCCHGFGRETVKVKKVSLWRSKSTFIGGTILALGSLNALGATGIPLSNEFICIVDNLRTSIGIVGDGEQCSTGVLTQSWCKFDGSRVARN